MDSNEYNIAARPSGFLVRLEGYSRRLYESEKNRSLQLNYASRNLFLILGATIAFMGAVIKWMFPEPVVNWTTHESWVLAALLACGLLFALASFMFILLTSHVRTFERLCDASALAAYSLTLDSDEDRLLAEIISNQIVAGGRNFHVNEVKAGMLARAYYCYFLSTGFIVTAATVGLTFSLGVL